MGEIPKHIWENDNFLKKLKSAVEVERMSLDERLAYELSLSSNEIGMPAWSIAMKRVLRKVNKKANRQVWKKDL